MQALLAEIVDIGDTGWGEQSAQKGLQEERDTTQTYGIRPGSCMFGTHPGAGEHRSYEAPELLVSIHVTLFDRQLTGGTYKLDGNLLAVQQIRPFKDHTKGAFADFLAHSVMDTDDIGRGGGHRG